MSNTNNMNIVLWSKAFLSDTNNFLEYIFED